MPRAETDGEVVDPAYITLVPVILVGGVPALPVTLVAGVPALPVVAVAGAPTLPVLVALPATALNRSSSLTCDVFHVLFPSENPVIS